MYILFDKHTGANNLYSTLGKALMVCNRYEESVKFVMNVILSSHGFDVNKIVLEDIFDRTRPAHKKIFDLSLGKSLSHPWLNEIVYFNASNLKILTDGKEARNFLCHESTLGFSYGYDFDRNYNSSQSIMIIHSNISRLCKAFTLISEFHYQIQEKEPSRFNRENYASDLEMWVIG